MAKVEVYTRRGCIYCARARMLLENKGVAYEQISIDSDPLREQEMVSRASQQTSVPQIFINDAHVGGSDELFELEQEGQLDALIQQNDR